MSPIRPPVLLLCAALGVTLGGGGVALAQEAADAGSEDAARATEEATDKVDEVIEERAAEEERDGEPSDADVGEASYNVSDCDPIDAGEEAADASAEDEASDTDADGEVAEKDLDECEPVTK